MMKKILQICLLTTLSLMLQFRVLAQNSGGGYSHTNQLDESELTDLKTFKKQYFNNYSRWSIGADFSMPFFSGDLSSLSDKKTYLGEQYGLRVSYQLTPTLGFALSGAYGRNKAGSPTYANEYLLGYDGMTYYQPTSLSGTPYSDVRSQIEFFSFGLHMNVNLNNLVMKNRGEQFFTVLLQPAVYLQKFDSEVCDIQGTTVTGGTLRNCVNFGAGGELAFRFRTCRLLDLQLSSGIVWIANNDFDGVQTIAKARDSYMWNVGVSAIFKLNRKKHKDNLLYAGSASYASNRELMNRLRQIDDELAAAREQITAEQAEVERLSALPTAVQPCENICGTDNLIERETIIVHETIPLPNVYFKTASSVVEPELYRNELAEVVRLIQENPTSKIRIVGYADHTGNMTSNQGLSYRRAQAMVDYLVSKGVSPDRLTITGIGNDPVTSAANQVSILARRVELTLRNESITKPE